MLYSYFGVGKLATFHSAHSPWLSRTRINVKMPGTVAIPEILLYICSAFRMRRRKKAGLFSQPRRDDDKKKLYLCTSYGPIQRDRYHGSPAIPQSLSRILPPPSYGANPCADSLLEALRDVCHPAHLLLSTHALRPRRRAESADRRNGAGRVTLNNKH